MLSRIDVDWGHRRFYDGVALRIVEAPDPSDEPLSLAELRQHLNLSLIGTTHPDDALIQRLGRAARAAAEKYTEQFFAPATVEVAFNDWTHMLSEGLPGGMVNELVSVTYRDDMNVPTALPVGQYMLDDFTRPARIREGVAATTWPGIGRGANPIIVRYRVGDWEAQGGIPEDVKAAMFLQVGDLYVHREDSVPVPVQALPAGVRALLNPHRLGIGV